MALTLSRKRKQSLILDGPTAIATITIISIGKDTVKLEISAPPSIHVTKGEQLDTLPVYDENDEDDESPPDVPPSEDPPSSE